MQILVHFSFFFFNKYLLKISMARTVSYHFLSLSTIRNRVRAYNETHQDSVHIFLNLRSSFSKFLASSSHGCGVITSTNKIVWSLTNTQKFLTPISRGNLTKRCQKMSIPSGETSLNLVCLQPVPKNSRSLIRRFP